MKKRKYRNYLIAEAIRKNKISSQAELSEKLQQKGIKVTQATLSRDLKTMRIAKIADENGKYMYILPDDAVLTEASANEKDGVIINGRSLHSSIEFSGNLAVIKTRNGYATGLAYDIDMAHSPLILGTIAGADTVFAILREGVDHDEALRFFGHFIPIEQGENV